jgi:hypothetical protein
VPDGHRQEVEMDDGKGRGERRYHTQRYAQRELKFWLSFGYPERPLGEFFKSRALGCGCRRVGRTGSPKVAGSMCHGCGYGWHPSVAERIDGNRLTKKWLKELRGNDPDDIDL